MSTMSHATLAVIAGALLVLAGCTAPPKSKPVVIQDPDDAFNATEQPYVPHDGRHYGTLSTDIQHLQNARRLYERSQERQGNATQRRQKHCRQQGGSRRVVVQGTPGKVVYCEPALNTRPSDAD